MWSNVSSYLKQFPKMESSLSYNKRFVVKVDTPVPVPNLKVYFTSSELNYENNDYLIS